MKTVTTVRLDRDDVTVLLNAGPLLGYPRTDLVDPGQYSQPARLARLAADLADTITRVEPQTDPAWWRTAVDAAAAAAGTGLPLIAPPDPDRFADAMAAQRAADLDTLRAAAALVAQAVTLSRPQERISERLVPEIGPGVGPLAIPGATRTALRRERLEPSNAEPRNRQKSSPGQHVRAQARQRRGR